MSANAETEIQAPNRRLRRVLPTHRRHFDASRPNPGMAMPDKTALSTPKGALRAYDAALPGGGLQAAQAAYHC